MKYLKVKNKIREYREAINKKSPSSLRILTRDERQNLRGTTLFHTRWYALYGYGLENLISSQDNGRVSGNAYFVLDRSARYSEASSEPCYRCFSPPTALWRFHLCSYYSSSQYFSFEIIYHSNVIVSMVVLVFIEKIYIYFHNEREILF